MERIPNARIADLVGAGGTAGLRPAPYAPGVAEEFATLLSDKLKVSGHAQTRLESRGIKLGDAEWKRVMEGVDKAAAKGARESLVLLDGVALLVSVKNRTLITAVDGASSKENVFTNIDSAVIV
ncbi:MAG: flagellar biosynthesis protein [Armatimonadota bacterium]